PILWYLTGIRPAIRSASDSTSSLTMSFDLGRGFHSAWDVRGHFSRRALPCLRLSLLDKAAVDSIPILLTPEERSHPQLRASLPFDPGAASGILSGAASPRFSSAPFS